MESVLNSLNESILVINDNGIIKFCNKSLLGKLQYKKEEIENTHISNIIDLNGCFNNNTTESIDKSTENIVQCVLYSRNKEKSYCYAQINVELWKGEKSFFIILKDDELDTLKVENNDLNKLIRNQIDLLVKNKVELNKCVETEQEIDLILNTAIDLMVIIDEDGKHKKVNKGWEKTLGWKEEELFSKRWNDIVYEGDIKDTNEIVKGIKNEKNIISFKNRCKCKNGNLRWIEWNIRYSPDRNASICTGRDITEKQELEEKKKSFEDAIRQETAKSEFLSNISHEFKTPLNIILATMQLININIERNNIHVEEGVNLKKYMTSMKQNCYRLLRLVNNFIDITKIETGYYEIKLENHNIVSVVEDITVSVAEYIEAKDIELIFDTEVEDEIIACDPDKIERIMLNLLSNAIKYTGKNGKIEVFLAVKGDNVIISIKDNGEGIPEDKLDLVFGRFIQVDEVLARRYQGSGIGLALSKSLVEMHGGSIGVTSKLGKGTKFEFSLPIRVLDTVEEDEESHINMKGIVCSKVEKYNIEFSDIYN